MGDVPVNNCEREMIDCDMEWNPNVAQNTNEAAALPPYSDEVTLDELLVAAANDASDDSASSESDDEEIIVSRNRRCQTKRTAVQVIIRLVTRIRESIEDGQERYNMLLTAELPSRVGALYVTATPNTLTKSLV